MELETIDLCSSSTTNEYWIVVETKGFEANDFARAYLPQFIDGYGL